MADDQNPRVGRVLAALGLQPEDVPPSARQRIADALADVPAKRKPSTDGSRPKPQALSNDVEELRAERAELVRRHGEPDPDDLSLDRDTRAAGRLLRALDRKLERHEQRERDAAEAEGLTPRELANKADPRR